MLKMALLVVAFVSTSVFAEEWSDKVKVTEIVAGYKAGFVLFRTSGKYNNPNGCEAMYSLDPVSANVELALSMLLAAQRSGAEILVGIDPTECGRAGVSHLSGKIKVTRVKSL